MGRRLTFIVASKIKLDYQLIRQVIQRVKQQGRINEFRMLSEVFQQQLRRRDARTLALYCIPRDDGQPHEFTGLLPKRVTLARRKKES